MSDSDAALQVLDMFLEIKRLQSKKMVREDGQRLVDEKDLALSDEAIASLTAAAIARQNFSYYETRENDKQR